MFSLHFDRCTTCFNIKVSELKSTFESPNLSCFGAVLWVLTCFGLAAIIALWWFRMQSSIPVREGDVGHVRPHNHKLWIIPATLHQAVWEVGNIGSCGSERSYRPVFLSSLVNLCLLIVANQFQELIVTKTKIIWLWYQTNNFQTYKIFEYCDILAYECCQLMEFVL